jgi:hypothetical protein
MYHKRTKHIYDMLLFIWDVIEKGETDVLMFHTSYNPAGVITKPVPLSKFKHFLYIC